jgi:hypothetical protein
MPPCHQESDDMTMYQRRAGDGQQIVRVLEDERRQAELLAEQLSDQATRLQRKAIEGLIALPAAVALRVAAATLKAVTFMARGFEVAQRASMETRDAGDEYRGERERAEGGRQQEPPRA